MKASCCAAVCPQMQFHIRSDAIWREWFYAIFQRSFCSKAHFRL